MNSDTNILTHLSIGPKANSQLNLNSFIEFFFISIWWITVDVPVISVVEKYIRLGLKYFIPLKKT